MESKQQQSSIKGGLVAVAVVAGATGFLGGTLSSSFTDNSDQNTRTDTALQAELISTESDLISAVAADVSPSVVSINVTSETQGFFRTFESEGAGTGIILSSDGYVITNRHVIPEGSEDIEITLSDGTVLDDVDVVGRDPRTGVDIAFLKINGENDLQPAVIGDSDTIDIGDKVIAIGNALGEFQNSVTTGIISGRSRPIVAGGSGGAEALTNLLQTDAAINPGNSGGPLLNITGQVIGINTAVAEGQNIGFAIPISDVVGSINSVLATGEFEVPFIGVRYEVVDDNLADQLDLNTDNGALVRGGFGDDTAVLEDSPAAKAGIQEDDIILSVNGEQINEDNGLRALIGKYSVGETLQLEVLRGSDNIDISVTLEAAPETL